MEPKNKKSLPKKEVNSITQYLGNYLPYWPLFIMCLCLSVLGGLLYINFSIPKYEATATIIIKDEKKGYDDSKLTESLDLINTKKIIENEVEVLQSRTLVNQVVKKLHLYAPIFESGKMKIESAYQSSPYIIEAKNFDSLHESKKINIEFNLLNQSILIDSKYTVQVGEWFQTPYGNFKFIPNNNYISRKTLGSYFFKVVPLDDISADIMIALKVAASSKLSSVIDLSYRDESAKRAENILNELMIAYSDAALNDKNSLAKNTLTFIEARLNIVAKDLDGIESKLQQYKTGKGAVDISKQGELYLQNVSENDKKLSDITMQLAFMDQLERSASSAENVGMLPSTLGVNDPALTQQMNNLSTLQTEYDKLKMTVAENNPLLTSISAQINQLKPTILNNIRSQRISLQNNRNNLNTAGGGYTNVLSTIPQKERQLVEISRDQAIKNGIYQFLLQKREESELSYASTLADSKVVNYALASKYPVSPNKIIIILVAILLGLGLPVAYLTLREILSPKVLFRNEIESLTNIRVIGEIAFNKDKEGQIIIPGKRTILAEEFRKIRVSLLSIGIDKNHKKILITSSISGEGKSFIAANLATSISLTGKKVILVDLDLHNPGLGKVFKIKDLCGVSEFLMGTKNLEDIIYKMPGNENLFYISSGDLQPNSSELLENGRVQTLIDQLDKSFDVVIIDAAPLVLITDGYLLSSLCDATLYIVRHKFTPKILIERIDANADINPIKNAAIIFNGVKTRGFFKNNYGYGYSYVYSYENKKNKKMFFSTKNV